MGTAISKLLSGGDSKAEVREQLQFLVNAARERLDRYQAELESSFADKSEIQRRAIPGNRAIRWVREYTVGVSDQPSDNVENAVDSFFGVANTESNEEKKDKIVDGFKSIVKGALDAFLGNAQVGEHEEKKFFVFVQHNPIICIDVMLWRYNFSSKTIMAEAQSNVLCYIICSSVVNRSALTFDEMIYLLSEYAGDENVEEYIDSLARVWKKMELVHIRDPGLRLSSLTSDKISDDMRPL
ncbi:hypothetical protein FS749_013902 [Ceratobasidium sp. UAMH 11750]|nr:hypothetical protein FS749_013902 [Ceratobasidium sp. UAMH 11750]